MTRRSLFWPLLIIVLGAGWLLRVAGAFPDVVDDLLLRSWPVLLVLFGFDALIGRQRLRLGRFEIEWNVIGGLLAVGGTMLIVWLAYQQQADKVRTDNAVERVLEVPASVERIELRVDVRRTALTLEPDPDGARQLTVSFLGSNESRVDIPADWELQGGVARVTIQEDYRNTIPALEDYGRGTISLRLPAGVPLQVLAIEADSGAMMLDLRGSEVSELYVSLDDGDLAVDLPAIGSVIGELRLGADAVLSVPGATTLELRAQGGQPRFVFNDDRWDLLANGILKPENVPEPYQINLNLFMSGGATLEVIDAP